MKNKTQKLLILGILFTLICGVSGCSSYMHGYTQSQAMGNYMKVDPESENFGYKRVTYIMGFRGFAVKSFIEEKGFPDYLHEYKKDRKEAFIFYYLQEGQAYEFVAQNWQPDSVKNTEIRDFSEFEMKRFGLKQ